MENFQSTLHSHVSAIQERRMDKLLATVSTDEALTIVMPNGRLVVGRQSFEALHWEWFSDLDWTFSAEIMRTQEREGMAFALLLVSYKDKDPQGVQYEKKYYLTLVFTHEASGWVLSHDQNTFL